MQVYIAVRDDKETADALDLLKSEGFADIGFLELDLVNPRYAKAAAEKFMKMEGRLDILGWPFEAAH
jgi:hypothetical protein